MVNKRVASAHLSQVQAATLALATIGMLLGVAIYWVVARGLGRLLFGAIAADPVAFAGMLLVLTAIAALAGYLPARALRAWTRWRLCA